MTSAGVPTRTATAPPATRKHHDPAAELTRSGVAVQARSGRSITRVLICDERPSIRLALTQAMRSISTVTEIDGVIGGVELVAAFAKRPADLVLIGHEARRNGGAQATQLLLSAYPSAVVLAFGAPDAAGQMSTAVTCGARGIMLWDLPQSGLSIGHNAPLSSAAPRRSGRRSAELTDRELQVLRGMSQGRSNAEIGRKLFLSEDTIKTHARKVFTKLGAHDRAHAVALGMRSSLVA